MAFEVTPEYVADAAANCTTSATEIEAQLQVTRNYVISLRDEYEGVAALNFDALMADFDAFGVMLHNALINIGDGLRGNFNNYTTVEEFATTNLVEVNGEIPGVYF
ncbi:MULTISPECIES: WXG100 family type VII secretion target [Catenuloplanes]|uniref:WXG100 family type VII secretion target n=1 Tax=Catenuloplanes niger TaxID=587534 RepID=A0AAE4CYI4_9ACTN|nr:WXG100 family type VII secretion target [Catenuloplanes niger]MDR7325889.1 WXG100 family type VII secretion target [Catenuloplanes niger]